MRIFLLIPFLAQAQTGADLFARLRVEAMEHSQVEPVFNTFTVVIGPRLTASPAHKRAAEFARDRLESYGLANAHLEPFEFGRGWSLEKLTVEMIEPRYLPLIGYADAWSPSTNGDVVAAPSREPSKGGIVMIAPPMTNFVRKDRPQPSDPNYVPMSAAYATSVGQRGRGAAPNPLRENAIPRAPREQP